MLKPLDLSESASWKERYRALKIIWSSVATQNPARGLVCSNKEGTYQLYAWHTESGELHRITSQPAGVVSGYISADGEFIYYLHDAQGNEIGHYFRVPFMGGEAEDITPDMPAYASFYITESHSGNALGFMAANQFGFQMFVHNPKGEKIFSYEHEALSVGPVLSHDGDVAVIATTEKTGTTDFSLEAYDISTGQKLGELWDGNQNSIRPIGFVPRAGDGRFLASTSKSGYARPLIWDPRSGERVDLLLTELGGEVTPWDWTEDGRYLLLSQLYQANYQLWLYDLEQEELLKLEHPVGTYNNCYFTPEGHIIGTLQTPTMPPHIIELDGKTGQVRRTLLQAGEVPAGRSWTSVTFPSGDTEIQGWLALPEGQPPFPTVIHTHGGPTEVQTAAYNADSQTWLEHGFAFLSINYHGSTTFGHEFEASIRGNLGELEVNDIAAGARWLISEGIAREDALFKMGGSYGGYLTLLTLGKVPELWRGGMAWVAIADWALMYEDMNEVLLGYLRGLFGGTPQDMPEQYRKSSPITYAENITADLLIIQGRNDTRCPARQLQVYLDTLDKLGKPYTVHWFDAGHGSRDSSQQVQHAELMLQMAYRTLGEE